MTFSSCPFNQCRGGGGTERNVRQVLDRLLGSSFVGRLRLTVQLSLKGPDRCRCCQAHRQSPSPRHLRKRTRSQVPLLRRHYPASTLLRPCPTPAMTVACRDVEAATLARDGSPPITRTTFPTCRAHYPGGSSGCACRLLPRSRGLPQMAGGSASALSLSRPAQASLTLRPAGLRPRNSKEFRKYHERDDSQST